jgi:hypothetical protein
MSLKLTILFLLLPITSIFVVNLDHYGVLKFRLLSRIRNNKVSSHDIYGNNNRDNNSTNVANSNADSNNIFGNNNNGDNKTISTRNTGSHNNRGGNDNVYNGK